MTHSLGVGPFAIDRGAWRLHGTAYGDGAVTLVFVHGWTCDRTVFEPQIGVLSATCRCLAFDLRGHGESRAPSDVGWEIADLADDVAAVIEHDGSDPVVVIGHSMGGTVACETAMRSSGAVAGLVLLHPMPLRHTAESDALFGAVDGALQTPDGHSSTRESIIDSAMFTDDSDPQLKSRLRDSMLDTEAATAAGCWSGLANYSPTHGPASDLAALVVNGVRAANEDALVRELLPSARIEHFPTGSFVHLEAPLEVNDLLADFVSELAST